ncbi:sporulation stage II, protein E [Neorhodopirellula pilleata]|nr:sporulation stage II, protein E [Neorhodopirellula pilleata]
MTKMQTTIDEAFLLEDSCDPTEVVASFWRAYSDATGLRIDPGTPIDPVDERRTPFAVTPNQAQGLAQAATLLADQLQRQHHLMTSQQAELAARAAVIASQSSRVHCVDQVSRVLADATMATGTQAAAVYMLDEPTEVLATRFVFGLSPLKRLGSVRPLRGARGDLEAMIQGIVAVNDLRAGGMDLYRSPEPFASGICLCLGDIELPIGTMWLFGKEIAEFQDWHTASARLAASHVAQTIIAAGAADATPSTRLSVAMPGDFELEASAEDNRQVYEYDDVRINATAVDPRPARVNFPKPTLADWTNQLSDWQHDTLPIGERLAPQWSIDAMIESPLAIAQSWHHWDVLPDGVLSMSICQHDRGDVGPMNMTSTLDATVARAALQAHACYRHTPGDAVMRVLATMLQVRDGAFDENGEPNLSLMYAHTDPETGHCEIASVGDWSTLVVSKYGFRPVGMGSANRLRPDEFMGRQSVEIRDTVLQPGEVLMVTGHDWMGVKEDDSLPADTRSQSAQNRIGSAVQKALRESNRSPLAAVRRMLANAPLTTERTAIALHFDQADEPSQCVPIQ